MLFLYKYREKEYAVKIVSGSKEDEKVKITFLAKTATSKGRMPKDKEVETSELVMLKDII